MILSTPRVGFGPTTFSLTANCSTTELPGNTINLVNFCSECQEYFSGEKFSDPASPRQAPALKSCPLSDFSSTTKATGNTRYYIRISGILSNMNPDGQPSGQPQFDPIKEAKRAKLEELRKQMVNDRALPLKNS